MSTVQKSLMELIGTFFFILTIAMTSSPFAIAAILMAWVYIGASVSGSHYNPAVSLGVALRGRLAWHDALYYMIMQVVGGFAAYAVAYLLKGSITVPAPGAGVSLMAALSVEILLTFVLVLVILVIATSEKYRNNSIFGFVIGFTISALAAVGGPISGGLFNPAIALGSTLFGSLIGIPVVLQNVLMHVGGALIGATLASYAFRYFRLDR